MEKWFITGVKYNEERTHIEEVMVYYDDPIKPRRKLGWQHRTTIIHQIDEKEDEYITYNLEENIRGVIVFTYPKNEKDINKKFIKTVDDEILEDNLENLPEIE